MEVIPYESAYHCPIVNSEPSQGFCSTNMFSSILNYVLIHDQINKANQNQLFISIIVLIIIFYIELKFSWPFLTFQRKKTSLIFNIFKKLTIIACLLFFAGLIYYAINDCIFYETYCYFN
jgi:hypothetical protein